MLNPLSPPPMRPAEIDPAFAWPQDILVPQDDGSASEAALAYAAVLASNCGGTVTGLSISVMPLPAFTHYADISADAWLAAREAAEAESNARFERIKPRFDRLVVPNELRRSDVWQGSLGDELASQARFADLVVIGNTNDGGSSDQRQLLFDALFQSGRPVIATPARHVAEQAPSRIIVAWQSTREATRAVHDALPLLKRADAVKLVVIDDGAIDIGLSGEPGADAARHLARHGVSVETAHVAAGGRSIANAILDEARYFGADLIVLGGYGHSRAREWLFGGVTRDILELSSVPLFLSH